MSVSLRQSKAKKDYSMAEGIHELTATGRKMKPSEELV